MGDDHLTIIAEGAGTTSPSTPLPARPSLPIRSSANNQGD
jgi:hypothetical protein